MSKTSLQTEDEYKHTLVTTKYNTLFIFLSFQKEVISWKYLKKLFIDGRCPNFLISGGSGESKIKLIISIGFSFALAIPVDSLIEILM